MQRYESSYVVAAPARRVWRLLHPRVPADAPSPRVLSYPNGSMEVLTEGDEAGRGLVRTCEFRVPRWLLSGGSARSWEVVVRAEVGVISHYRGVCKPLWARMEGWHGLEAIDEETTRLSFVELYDVVNPALRAIAARRVHAFISADNDALYRSILGHLGEVTVEHRRATRDPKRLRDNLAGVASHA